MHLRRRNLGRQHGLRPVALRSRAFCHKTSKTLRGHPLKPQTIDPSTRRRMVLLCLACLTSPPNSKLCPELPVLHGIARPSTPPHVVAQIAPGCNRSSCGAVLEEHRAFFYLGVAAASREAASLGHPADFKEGRQRLQHVPATAAAQPQNRLENLNSEEPGSPTPSVPDPELGLHAFDCRVCAAEQVGLAWPKYRGGGSHHTSTGATVTVTRTLLPRLQLHSRCSCGRWRSFWVPA